jgi:crotonobetainyl-CoA:carnitine CoA-transferase CaiB-like acyl-CoA transferase
MTIGTGRAPSVRKENRVTGPLGDLRVLEISNTLPGAQVGLLLADLGAEVIAVEPAGGSPLRSQAGFPFLARGKQSVVLDLHARADAESAWQLASEADVVVTTLRPAALERFGLDYQVLSVFNPAIVYGSITGWGRTGPLRDAKGYEGMVLAKIGAMATSYAPVSPRPGPTFATAPYASWSAAQALLQGIFAALREREDTGAGQLVEASLALAMSSIDPWNQVNAVITQRFPDAFLAAPTIDEDGFPNYSFTYRLLVANTADGHWLQFSQVQPRLFRAFLRSCGLEWMYDDPEWKGLPEFDDRHRRMAFWNILLGKVRERTLAEWQQVFEDDKDVFAEIFRRGTGLLHHPQLEFARQTITLTDAERGAVLQPAALIKLDGEPACIERSAPELDQQGPGIRARVAGRDTAPPTQRSAPDAPSGTLPLAGVTILELGTFYAAPNGATLLTDLGARVIKIEPLEGDPMRHIQPFPEAGAMKVLQGKESVALDLAAPEAKEILGRIVPTADLVLCSFRAGVADRLGVGAKDLLSANPRMVYLDAPGFGIDGPYGGRPAFAPTMSAGAGVAMRNVGAMVPEDNTSDLPTLRARALQLTAAGGGSVTQPDGVAALAVGTALSLGAYLQRRGHEGQHMLTTMLQSCAHMLAADMVEYPGRPAEPQVDACGYGLGARYRLYQAADDWVFLAVPSEKDWRALTAVDAFASLAADPRFATEEGRPRRRPRRRSVQGVSDRSRRRLGTRTARRRRRLRGRRSPHPRGELRRRLRPAARLSGHGGRPCPRRIPEDGSHRRLLPLGDNGHRGLQARPAHPRGAARVRLRRVGHRRPGSAPGGDLRLVGH